MTGDSSRTEPIDESRRSLLKSGALVSSGFALGLGEGTGTVAADGEVARDGDGNSMNLADVGFLQLMAYHHRGGIEAAQLVGERTAHEQLRQFAETVVRSQRRGIQRIEGILADAGIEPGDLLRADLDDVREFLSAIPGQPTASEIAYLESLEGPDFDLRFIERFTYHHSGAIQLSQRVLQAGESPVVADLAEEIIAGQLEEIVKMYQWYLEWV